MTFRQLLVGTLVLFVTNPCGGQQNDQTEVKVKIFDANNPAAEPLIPSRAIVFYRNQATKTPELLGDIRLVPVDSGFYRLMLPKNQLIEQITITVSAKSGTNFNPAVIAKVVSRESMTIYPGASDPGETFGIKSYIAQLATYDTLLNQLIDEFGTARAGSIQSLLRREFGSQLQQMAKAERERRIIGATPEQLRTAKSLLEKVLVGYGLIPKPDPHHFAPLCVHDEIDE